MGMLHDSAPSSAGLENLQFGMNFLLQKRTLHIKCLQFGVQICSSIVKISQNFRNINMFNYTQGQSQIEIFSHCYCTKHRQITTDSARYTWTTMVFVFSIYFAELFKCISQPLRPKLFPMLQCRVKVESGIALLLPATVTNRPL